MHGSNSGDMINKIRQLYVTYDISTMGVHYRGQGVESSRIFGVGDANANRPPDFHKMPLSIHSNTPFQAIFFWEWAISVRGYPLLTPYPSPEPSLLDAPMRPRRIPAFDQ